MNYYYRYKLFFSYLYKQEHGLLLVGGDKDGDSSKPVQAKVGTIVVVSPEAAELLEMVGDGALDVRLKKFVEERKELLEQVRKRRIIFYIDALFMVQCLAGIIP